MKSTELHRMFIKKGGSSASVAMIAYKNEKGELTEPVPYHGAKEMGKGLALNNQVWSLNSVLPKKKG